MDITPIRFKNDQLEILDQTMLPWEECYISLTTKEDLWDAIHTLKVRGAPAIGVAAAFGLYVLSKEFNAGNNEEFTARFRDLKKYIGSSRPTAVNLFWAMDRMESALMKSVFASQGEYAPTELLNHLKNEAVAIRAEDEAACKAMGEYGLTLLKPGMGLLTHCNAGTIATAKYGTSLSPIYLGHERGYGFHVFVDETRPLMQGARLTSWELQKAGVDVTLICDSMAATVMKNHWVDAILVGCDRMAKNGDGANKIGTLGLAILAREYHIPFYMFAPTSTIDLSTPSGKEIVVECRSGAEVTSKWFQREMAPKGVKVYNPAFDVTDQHLITAVITEKGIVRPPFDEGLAALFK